MAIDFATIFSAINGANKAAQEDNPWATLTGMTDSLGQEVVKSAAGQNTGDAVMAGILAGLTGGLSRGLSNSYVDEQTQLAQNALSEMMMDDSGASVFQRPDGMSPSVFQSLKSMETAKKMGQAADIAEDKRKAKQAMISGIIQSDAKSGGSRIGLDLDEQGNPILVKLAPQQSTLTDPSLAQSKDPMTQDFVDARAAATSEGVRDPIERRQFIDNFVGLRQKDRARKEQMTQAEEERRRAAANIEAKALVDQAGTFQSRAQSIEDDLAKRGEDTYTGKMGDLQYWWDKNFNPNDPKVSAAKRLGEIGAMSFKDIRSDAQIAEAERRMAQERLISETAPADLIQSKVDAYKLMSATKTAQARFIQKAAMDKNSPLEPDEARILWAEAYNQVDLFVDDPITGRTRYAKPEEFMAQMQRNIAALSGQPMSPQGTTPEPSEQPPGPAPKNMKWVYRP